MSWSISFIGTPAKISEAIDKFSESASGQSKAEFDKVKEHLKALVGNNFSHHSEPVVRLVANGHGSFYKDQQESGHLQVSIEPVYGLLV